VQTFLFLNEYHPDIMRTLLVTLLLLHAFSSLLAQSASDSVVAWNKWCAKKDTLLLFYGANNTIQVYCKGMKPNEFKLKSLDKNLRIGSPEITGDTVAVLAMPYKGKDPLLKLAVLNSKTSKVMRTLAFAADSIPKPAAKLGNINNPESFKKTILSQSKLRVYFPNSLYSYPYTVKQYVFKTHNPKGPVSIPVNSFFLNTPVLREIAETPDGNIIEFTEIQATCPECATRSLDDLRTKIKVASLDTTHIIRVPAK
jgi:hypothetical protein